MRSRIDRALDDPVVRRVFEEELLVGEATDTIAGLLESLQLTQKELASRLGVSAGRVSQILSGEENLTLRSLAALGWALGIRFDLAPVPMSDRSATPASSDPPAPAWIDRLRATARLSYEPVSIPEMKSSSFRPHLRVVSSGEVKAA